MEVTQSWRGGVDEWSVSPNEYKVSVWYGEKVLEMDGGDGHRMLSMC